MSAHTENIIGRFLVIWTSFVAKYATAVVIFFVTISSLAIYLTINHLDLNTNTEDMLDENLQYRQTLKAFKQDFPELTNTLLIVIDGENIYGQKSAAHQLTLQLRKNEQSFKSVYHLGGGRFFAQQGLLFIAPQKLDSVLTRISQSQPLLAQLQNQANSVGLFKTLQRAAVAPRDQTNLDLSPLLEKINHTLAAYNSEIKSELQWQELLFDNRQHQAQHQLIIVQPRRDFSQLSAAGKALKTIRETAQSLQIDANHGLRIRITGDAALADDEMKSVKQGMGLTATMSLVMVIVLLWFGTGSFRILLFSIISLLIGLSLTAGFATWAIGSLNLISIAFAVLYIGLGIDFSIHLCLRYEELLTTTNSNINALREASRDVGASLVLCSVSTAIGFYAFIPTEFIGVSELGLISGTGMFISLIVSLSLLPALFHLSPIKTPAKFRMRSRLLGKVLNELPLNHHRAVIVAAICLAIVAIAWVPQARFDYDLLNMRSADSESVQAFRDLIAHSETPPWRLTVLTENRDQATDLQNQLLALPTVNKVMSITDFIPAEQDKKLLMINKTAKQMTSVLTINKFQDTTTSSLTELQQIHKTLQTSVTPWPEQIKQLASNLETSIEKIEALSATDRTPGLQALDYALMGSLSATLVNLKTALTAQPVNLNNLPKDLAQRWIGTSGTQRLLVFARDDLNDTAALRHFVTEVSSVATRVTDIPAINLAAGDAAIGAFQQAFISAIVLISILLLILMRSIRDAIIVLVPLVLAGLLTTAASVIFNIPFNFANIIALPLLLGIGVDNGIHMVSRARVDNKAAADLMKTSTARAVTLSALTTIASFGNLGYSPHPGTASMGQLLTIGVFLTMVCTILVLPSLLKGKAGAKPVA